MCFSDKASEKQRRKATQKLKIYMEKKVKEHGVEWLKVGLYVYF